MFLDNRTDDASRKVSFVKKKCGMGKHINKKESQRMRRDSFLFIKSKIGLQVVNAEFWGGCRFKIFKMIS